MRSIGKLLEVHRTVEVFSIIFGDSAKVVELQAKLLNRCRANPMLAVDIIQHLFSEDAKTFYEYLKSLVKP